MKTKALILTLIFALFTGCSAVRNGNNDGTTASLGDSSDTVTIEVSDMTTNPSVTTAEEVTANVPEVLYQEFFTTIEAEMGIVSGSLRLSQSRSGYSGAGYISGFDLNSENKIEISSMLPSNQHYNITLAVASDKKENNLLTVNNSEVGEFVTSGSGEFEAITFKNVYISKGIVRIGITEVTGGIDLDYIIIQSSTDVEGLSFNISDTLINDNANEKTKNTMRFMVENFGTNIISGQYASVGSNKELDVIYQTTGRYPAMRLGDMLPYTTQNADQTQEIEHAMEWSRMGGLVGYVWHWLAPSGNRSCYSDETEFDPSKAVTDIEVADMTLQELGELVADGEISDECYQLIRDIDMVSEQLKILQENNVTVLWRPLHEASGGWFWWGSAGEDAYKWLWELLYSRQTNFHGLNNLIWVWNAQMDGWYVGDELCDVISADIYVDSGSLNSQVNTFIQLNKISPNKLIALSECANSPSPDLMIRDSAVWSFFGVWCGDYVMNEQCVFSEKYITKSQLIDIYSHQNVLTLEKLPDLR